jgi:predicted AlkP superfamily pyrophosphatase or phosphodiesterase
MKTKVKYVIPDYDNSIVNLSSVVAHRFNVYSPYKPLKINSLNKYKTIIFLIADGLGYEYLKNTNSFLKAKVARVVTSVFPSSTASAITAIQNAEAPQQHALTGWFVHLKEFGAVSVPLKFSPRFGEASYENFGAKREMIFTGKSITKRMKKMSFTIYSSDIISKNKLKGRRRTLFYKKGNLNEMLKAVKKALACKGEKLIYAYTGIFDSACHHFGCRSPQALRAFQKIEKMIEKLSSEDALIIVSADHGLIDTEDAKVINLNHHENLYSMLSLPLSGDGREVYCYVKASKAAAFEEYVKKYLSHACFIYKSEELVKKGFFGRGIPNKKLFDRIGDYTLICKENYVIIDTLLNQKLKVHKGNHGGLSREEMLVPVIVIEPKSP